MVEVLDEQETCGSCSTKCSYNWKEEGCAKIKRKRRKPSYERVKMIDDTDCTQFNVCINGESFPLFVDIDLRPEPEYKQLTNICV